LRVLSSTYLITQAKQLASEYDLAAKTKQALGVVGELADTAIVKTVELEKEYDVVAKVSRPYFTLITTPSLVPKALRVLHESMSSPAWMLDCTAVGPAPCITSKDIHV
jgi:hypothetical protein